MNYTEEQLKSALVRALPEKLAIDTDFHNAAYWHGEGEDCSSYVTPHEWPAIVGMVEAELTDEQWLDYMREITEKSALALGKWASARILMSAKWPIRAQALADIGAITVTQ